MSRADRTNTDQRKNAIPAPISLAVKATTFSLSESDLRTLEQPIKFQNSEVAIAGTVFPTSALYCLYQAVIKPGSTGLVSTLEVGQTADRLGNISKQKLEAIHRALEVLSQLEQPFVQALQPGTQETQKWAITLKGREVVRAIKANTDGVRLLALEQGDLSFRSLLKALGGVEFGQASLASSQGMEALRKRA